MEFPNLHINDEISELKSVILGISTNSGKEGKNARVDEARRKGTYPSEAEVEQGLKEFESVLKKHDIEVFRPVDIENLRQTFTRDIGFVIDDCFVVSNMKEENRVQEIKGIEPVLSLIDKNKIYYPPDGVYIEGGDVIQLKDTIFVGTGRRSNEASVAFLRSKFPSKRIISFEMVHETNDPLKSILHLDCAFQPVGEHWALFYEEGFKSSPQVIKNMYKENLIPVDSEEMYKMSPNIFSLSPKKVVSCPGFTWINDLLRSKGIEVITVSYEKVAALGGLLRCSTLPLVRH